MVRRSPARAAWRAADLRSTCHRRPSRHHRHSAHTAAHPDHRGNRFLARPQYTGSTCGRSGIPETFHHSSMKRIVVKLGTGVLAKPNGRSIDTNQFRRLCDEFAELAAEGHSVILVSSGAITAGIGVL